jgi:DNA polymerase III delta subunit
MLVKDFDKAVELAGNAGPGGVFLVSGEEPFQALRLETVLEARARALGLETARIPGDEVQPGDIRRLSSEGSLFSSGRFILIRNIDAVPAKAQSETLEAVAAQGSNHLFLFLTERTSLNTVFLKKLAAAATAFACWEPFAGKMWPWTKRLSGELGLKLDRQASETTEALSYGKLLNLWSLLERASIRYGSGTVVNQSMIIALSGGLPECNALDMSQDAVTGNGRKALEKLSLLLASGEEPIRLLALMHSQWALAAAAASLLSRGRTEQAMISALGISPYRARWVVSASAHWRGRRYAPIADAFSEADFRLKRGWDSMAAITPLVVALTLPRE